MRNIKSYINGDKHWSLRLEKNILRCQFFSNGSLECNYNQSVFQYTFSVKNYDPNYKLYIENQRTCYSPNNFEKELIQELLLLKDL